MNMTRCGNKLSQPRRQSGAALLIALLAVVIASLIATQMIESSRHSIARTEALLNSERAWQYAHGMNELALEWIEQAEQDAGFTGLSRLASWTPPFAVAGGSVSARLLDLSGRFNLNSLSHPDPERALAARRALDRLLASLNLDRSLSDEIQSWVRDQPGEQSGRYTQRNPPYLKAGMPFTHLSELRWLIRFTPETQRRLLPYVNALPDPQARLNINQTNPIVLSAWLESTTVDQAERILSAGPFESLDQVRALPELSRMDRSLLDQQLSVNSQWFLAQARVILNGQPQDFFHLIHRGGSGYDFRYFSQAYEEPGLTASIPP